MFDAIAIYLAVAEAGSFSLVAKKLGMAVSSVTRKVDSLEAELGYKLFTRSSRLVLLTDAGETFLRRAQHLLAELDDAKLALSSLNADPRGLLTVTAPSSFGRLYVAPAVLSFLQRYPLMEVDLHIGDEIIDLAAQRLDVAIRLGGLPDSDLVASRLAPLRIVVCASPAYIARHGRPKSPEDLLNHNCLTAVKAASAPRLWAFAEVNKGESLAVRGNYCSNDTQTLLAAALAGLGVVHLATWLVKDALATGQLVALFPSEPVQYSKLEPAIHAVRMPGRSHVVKTQLFIDHLRSEFGTPCYWDQAIAALDSATY
jgi:DNA-binding transcriptional LysR family regulator